MKRTLNMTGGGIFIRSLHFIDLSPLKHSVIYNALLRFAHTCEWSDFPPGSTFQTSV